MSWYAIHTLGSSRRECLSRIGDSIHEFGGSPEKAEGPGVVVVVAGDADSEEASCMIAIR